MALNITSKRLIRPFLAQFARTGPCSPLNQHAAATRHFWSSVPRALQASQHITVNINGTPKSFDAAFLRDSCGCTQCVDPHSKQKLFQTSDIPLKIEAVQKEEKDGIVELAWKEDVPGYASEHRTQHSIEWLSRAANVESELQTGKRSDDRVLWNRDTITKDNKWVDFKSYMENEQVFFDALSHLNKYGLLFLRNVPESEKSVEDIAGRIGNIKDTFYGRTWDVKSKPNAKNIAYTQVFLGLHMDLLYTSNPPHLQFLHSLRARTPGGESLFSDSFHAAKTLYASSPSQFETLTTFPVTYHYHNDSQHYHYTRPTIELFPSSDPSNPIIDRINWSPPFQAPFESHIINSAGKPTLRDYISASNAFEKLLSSEENLFEYRLEEGECVVFDNRRVLHARRAFDASKGERWLKGTYVDDDVFFSRLRVLEEKFKGGWVADGVVRKAVGGA